MNNNLNTLNWKQRLIIAAAVIAWAILLDQYSDVNFAQPLVEYCATQTSC